MSKLASTTGLISALNGPNSSPNFSAQSVPWVHPMFWSNLSLSDEVHQICLDPQLPSLPTKTRQKMKWVLYPQNSEELVHSADMKNFLIILHIRPSNWKLFRTKHRS
jgi:hypothetical protein